MKNGKAVDSVVLQTAGKPAGIRLTADRTHIHASRNDLAYVTAEMVDAENRLVPDAVLPLHFSIDGNGEIIATGNANPSDVQSFQKPEHTTFRGKCLIIVRPSNKPGNIILKAEGHALTAGEVKIETN